LKLHPTAPSEPSGKFSKVTLTENIVPGFTTTVSGKTRIADDVERVPDWNAATGWTTQINDIINDVSTNPTNEFLNNPFSPASKLRCYCEMDLWLAISFYRRKF
jgi:hypothetical protein